MKKILSVITSFLVFISTFNIFVVSSEAETKKDFYSYLADCISDYENNIDISEYMIENNWTIDDLKINLKNLYLLEPEFFYVGREVKILFSADRKKFYIDFKYLYSEKEIKKMNKEMKKAALKAIEDIEDDMNDDEKALIVHDYLILNTDYDYSDTMYSAYDCLVNKSSVCQGYSLAFMYIMRDLLGVDCTVVFTDTQNHAWNYIKIDDDWYHVDLTADDPTSVSFEGEKFDSKGQVLHKNFLLSDEACYKSSELHRDWNTLGLPKAESKKYDNYFWKNTTTAVCKIDGLWYYTVVDNNSPGMNYIKGGEEDIYTKICTYSFGTKKRKVILRMNSSWNLYRNAETGKILTKNSWYKTSFMKLVKLDGKLYFNTSKAVYRLDTNTKKAKKVYTLKRENMSIYSILLSDNSTIRVVYKKDLSYNNNYLKIKFKNT